MPDFHDSLAPPSRPVPVREDCWSEEASSTLVDAWGRRYIELNRGNLRQKDWQDVADAVNALHGHTKKTHRTDVQCKNRIDTIKKKYKIEKARVSSSNGALSSSWPFFDRLDSLIGPNFNAKKPTSSPSPSPPVALPLLPHRKNPSSPVIAVPQTALALPQKRSAGGMDEGYFRRNYSAMAAAAAAAEADEEEEEEEEEEEVEEEEEEEDEGRGSEVEEGEKEREGMKRLAKAIERFGEVYERVEGQKLRQMVDLEKQRMQFAKDLEAQRMQMFMDTQVQLERIKRGKRSGSNVLGSCCGLICNAIPISTIPSEQSMSCSSYPKVKATWTPSVHKIFVDLCLQETLKGNKPGSYFTKEGWKNIMESFYAKAGLNYGRLQLKNHRDSTKEQWKFWCKLIGTSYMKWDPSNQKFEASEEDWIHYL